MRVAMLHHQAKSAPLADALAAHGHELVGGAADVLLLDSDNYAVHGLVDRYADAGAKVFLYPHGAPLHVALDGIYPPYHRTTGAFVFGHGGAEVLRRMAYPGEIHVMGWPWSAVEPFRPAEEVREVLLAPFHPLRTGMPERTRRLNAAAYAELLTAPGVHVTVRHIGTPEENGLWPHERVTFAEGRLDNGTEQLDAADVVVGGVGTFPCLAMARGRPTIVYGSRVPLGSYEDEAIPLRHLLRWDRYADLLAYPLEVGDAPMPELLRAAGRGTAATARWRERFIGEPFDPAGFVEQLLDAVVEPPPDARGFLVVAEADEVLDEPSLLRAYLAAIGPDDDITLLLWAHGARPEALLPRLEDAIARTGAVEPLADLVVDVSAPPRLIAARAKARLGDRPAAAPLAELPTFGGAEAAALREHAHDHLDGVAALHRILREDAARGVGRGGP